MIAVIDYDMGNVGSIQNMLKRIGEDSVVTSGEADLREASGLILPGVGAFDTGMEHLEHTGLLPVLHELVLVKEIPVLGICLGMQLLSERSEEGQRPGLGWIRGQAVRFRFDPGETGLKIPHMGWNTLRPIRTDTLFGDMLEETAYYFVHSYHVECANEGDVLGLTHHGYDFVSAVQSSNILGTQFHPEKSHRYGMRLLQKFVEMT